MIHCIFSCAGAGTAADLEMTTLQMSSQLELHRLNTGRTVKVATANRLLKQMLFRYQVFHLDFGDSKCIRLISWLQQGHISAALVLGGIVNELLDQFAQCPQASANTHGNRQTYTYGRLQFGEG